MKQAKAGLTGLSPTEKVAKALLVETMMAGNLNFPTPDPTLVALGAGRVLLTNAITDSAGGDHEKVVIRQKAEDALGILLLREALYVSNVAQGDELIILSSGFEARKPPTPIGPLATPTGLLARMGNLPGSIDLRWDPVKGAHWYRLLVNSTDPDVEAQWTVLDEITQASFAATGLDPAKHYWFRVCAVGPLGPGAFSDPAKGFSAPLP